MSRSTHNTAGPQNQRPELWNLYNGRVCKGESIRVFPLSNWTEQDICASTARTSNCSAVLRSRAQSSNATGCSSWSTTTAFRWSPVRYPRKRWSEFPNLGLLPVDGRHRATPRTCRPSLKRCWSLAPPSAAEPSTTMPAPWKRKARRLLRCPQKVFCRRRKHHDQVSKPTLRFPTCGSVDDGKSTLIGRLLDSKLISKTSSAP